jgi:thimet oligopeptidase
LAGKALKKTRLEYQAWLREYDLDASFLHHKTGDIENPNISCTDAIFLKTRYNKKVMGVDEQRLSEYFPLTLTLQKLLNLYERILDLKLSLLDDDGGGWWHPDVRTLEMRNTNDELLGYIALDLHPREGKYSHACCHGLTLPNNGPGLAVLLCNFSYNSHGLQHQELVTLFHELGHGLHFLLGRHQLCTNQSFNVPVDFLEAPSQFLEQFMWDAGVLSDLGSHYETGEQLPPQLVTSKVASRDLETGSHVLIQLAYSLVSLELHKLSLQQIQSLTPASLTQLQVRIRTQLDGLTQISDTDHIEASFSHLASDYSTRYYGYMWALGYALLMYDHVSGDVEKRGPEYSRCVLQAAATRDVKEGIEEMGIPVNNINEAIARVFEKNYFRLSE